MKKLLSSLLGSLLISGTCYAQPAVQLNLICQINGEITSLGNGVTTVPITNVAMSVLVEKGIISISDGNNYFSNKMRASVGVDTIFAADEWKPNQGESRKQYIEINRNTGMVAVSKDITIYGSPSILIQAKASGNCEKLANKKKF